MGARITVDHVLECTAAVFEIPSELIVAKGRVPAVVRARQAGFYVARNLTDLSYPVIGRGFGGRDHSTVMDGVKMCAAFMERDAGYRRKVEMVSAMALGRAEDVAEIEQRRSEGDFLLRPDRLFYVSEIERHARTIMREQNIAEIHRATCFIARRLTGRTFASIANHTIGSAGMAERAYQETALKLKIDGYLYEGLRLIYDAAIAGARRVRIPVHEDQDIDEVEELSAAVREYTQGERIKNMPSPVQSPDSRNSMMMRERVAAAAARDIELQRRIDEDQRAVREAQERHLREEQRKYNLPRCGTRIYEMPA